MHHKNTVQMNKSQTFRKIYNHYGKQLGDEFEQRFKNNIVSGMNNNEYEKIYGAKKTKKNNVGSKGYHDYYKTTGRTADLYRKLQSTKKALNDS
jgi:hypothetical protein